MVRSFFVGLILIAAISPATAQKAREHLPAINGVEFGSTFAAAREKLGHDFEADTDPDDDKVKTLLGGPVPFNGANYMFNYTFGGAGERLTTVYAQNINSRDFAVCRANWSTAMSGLTAQFGKPEEMSEDFGTRRVPSDHYRSRRLLRNARRWLYGSADQSRRMNKRHAPSRNGSCRQSGRSVAE